MPSYGVFKTVVAPKALPANNKSWSTEDIQSSRLACVVLIRATDAIRVRGFYNAILVLTDFTQTFRKIWFSADLLAFYKPTSVANPYIVGAPPFHFSQNCDPAGQIEILQRIWRRNT